MAELDEYSTQREMTTGIASELAIAGFGEAAEIGRGGFGVVYRCHEYALKRSVAIKVLMSEVHGDERRRFVDEQQALGRLSGHPHIVQILQVDVTATGRPYLVMPFHSRGSLELLLHNSGPLRWPRVLSIGVRVAGALAASHAVGIVHRDVKPGNILLTDYGEPQLADFGIAHFGEPTTNSAHMIHGTPAFTAPEVLGGAVPGVAADVYSLGATLYSLLSGHAAFARHTGEPLEAQLARIATAPIPNLREYGIPDAVCTAIENAMATKPEDRPESAQSFGELLQEIQRAQGHPVDAMAVPLADDETSSPTTPSAMFRRLERSRTPTPPPIAATKFRPPSPPRSLVDRERLLDLLRQGGERRLTLIHGPAGFGKTTLAAQWAHHLEDEGLAVAWMTADPDDNNAVWLLAHLVDAIRRVRPELAGELGTLLEERSSDTVRYVLSTLIDEIHSSAKTMVLVVDDWHQVTSRSAIAALDFLLEHGCHHLRLVVASRMRTGLPLARLLVQDELVEIDVTALRFDREEASSFLVDTNALSLTDSDVRRLQESTEGWPAALQLVSLSLRGRTDPGDFIDKLTGRHHAIAEYLAENVLDALAPDLLDFLLATSVTERTCADLAVVLTGRSDSHELLDQVADRNLFLERMDDDSEWFRYHRLFADYLRRRLIRQDPARLTDLHRLASDWFAEHQMLGDAIDSALASGDPQRAVDLLEVRATDLIENSRMATFLGLVAKLPGNLTDVRPRLQLCVAWANIGLQRRSATKTAVQKAVTTLDANHLAESEATSLRVETAIVTSIQDYLDDRFTGLSDLVTGHLEDATGSFGAISRANLAAIDASHRFDFDAADLWFSAAVRHGRHHGPFTLMFSHALAGLAAWERLDIGAAEEYLGAAVTVSLRAGKSTYSSILSGALLGGLRYEQGHWAEAQELLDASAHLELQGGPVDFLLETYCTGARLLGLRGDLESAEARLTAGERLAIDRSLPRLSARIFNERIRLGLPISAAVRERLLYLPLYHQWGNRIDDQIAELDQDSAIRLLLGENTRGAAEKACARSASLVQGITPPQRPHALIRRQLLHACCLWATNQPDEAIASAAGPLTLCNENGLSQLIADAGPQMAIVVQAVRSR
ncbi:protein kinase [Nocardia sp. NPDC059240]|uniref:protein kinase domain-containing protein n=1 Tax=Nocardia sp. NPDC059240 TaxID=3346786 RepID=UPI0036858F72